MSRNQRIWLRVGGSLALTLGNGSPVDGIREFVSDSRRSRRTVLLVRHGLVWDSAAVGGTSDAFLGRMTFLQLGFQ